MTMEDLITIQRELTSSVERNITNWGFLKGYLEKLGIADSNLVEFRFLANPGQVCVDISLDFSHKVEANQPKKTMRWVKRPDSGDVPSFELDKYPSLAKMCGYEKVEIDEESR